MSEWLSTDDPLLSRVKQKREAILAEVGHTHLATVYWPGDKDLGTRPMTRSR